MARIDWLGIFFGTPRNRRRRLTTEPKPPRCTGGGRIMQAAPEDPDGGVVPSLAESLDMARAHEDLYN
ncbi:MAG: hypothetical protein AAB964_02715 [Patescibacteria group bacterium]